MQIYDRVVIGAGISGTYLSARLHKTFPRDSLLQIDKLDNYGGVLVSAKVPGEDVWLDYGGIRWFPSIHPRTDALVKCLNLPAIPYNFDQTGTVSALRGDIFQNDALFPATDVVYNLLPSEKLQNPFAILNDNLTKLIPFPEEIYTLAYRIELSKDVVVSTGTFKTLAKQGLSEENWKRIVDIIGYGNILDIRASFLVDANEYLSLTGKSDLQLRIKTGYQTLPIAVAQQFGARITKFKKLCPKRRWQTLFNTYVSKIEKVEHEGECLWKITINKVRGLNNTEDLTFKRLRCQTIYARHIYNTIHVQFIQDVYDWKPSFLSLLKYDFVPIRLARIYLKFSEDWMTQLGIGFGSSTSNNNQGKIIHYSDKIVMIYNIMDIGTYSYGLCPPNKVIQKEMVPPNPENQPLIDGNLQFLKENFGLTELPPVELVSWAFWIEPINLWTGGVNQQTQNRLPIFDNLIEIMFPFGQKGRFYNITNDISLNQGWVEGSLEIVDMFMNFKYGQNIEGWRELCHC